MFGLKLSDVEKYVKERFPELVKRDKDGQETEVSLTDHVAGAIKSVADTVSDLAGRVGANEKALKKADGDKRGWVQADIVGLGERSKRIEDRLNELESERHRSGVVSGVVEPRGEVTLNDLKGFATEVSDEGYRRLRDYFLLEMAKHGYESKHPDFRIFDSDSGLAVSLSVTDSNGRILRNSNNRVEQTYRSPDSYPATFELKFNDTRSWLSTDHIAGSQHNRLEMQIEGSEYGKISDWATQLRSDFPELYKAYMFGYIVKVLDAKLYDIAAKVQKKHGLEENSELATRMKEIIAGGDANLANAVATHYGED